MRPSSIDHALTSGLLAGYGGKTEFKSVTRGGFEVSSSHYEQNGIIYHDEWTNGGGQEIVSVDGRTFTRVYAGGIISNFAQPNAVIEKLVAFIQRLGNRTRLSANASDQIDQWSYEYQVTQELPEFNITTGREVIKYQNQVVFVHCFVISPITA